MKIMDVVVAPGVTGFYFDDQQAIKAGAVPDGNTYFGTPMTDGFTKVRQRGESISIQLLLEDGQVAYGDCAAVQYSGAGGRDPLFLAKDFVPMIEAQLVPVLRGRLVKTFRSLAEEFDRFTLPGGQRLHTAIRYGLTQALLDAVARARKQTMAEVIASEYGTSLTNGLIPIFCQTGDDRYVNADKAIIKGAQVLPHGLINHVGNKLGAKGERLAEYVAWLRERILKLGYKGYQPVLHIDVYGTIGIAFNHDFQAITRYLKQLEEVAKPFHLRIEGPVDVGSKAGQIETLASLRRELETQGVQVEIVADEWCNTFEDIVEFVDAKAGHMVQIKTPDLGGINNTIEAILYAKSKGIGAYLGGTCNETDRSAQVCAHIALATNPDQMLAKPGMGVDEGFMIIVNELNRTRALLSAKGVLKGV